MIKYGKYILLKAEEPQSGMKPCLQFFRFLLGGNINERNCKWT